jgi:hypothetical protein
MSVTFLDQDGVARLVGTILGITPGGNLASTLAAGNDALGQQIVGLANPTNPQDADTLFSRDAAIAVVLLDPRFPSTDEKAALAGTAGTPDAGNPYVTTTDARNANARTPTAHSHAESDVTNLGTHTHAEADVTSLVADLALKEPGSPVIWTTVVKGSDQSVASSTAVANDSALFFATVNGAVYELEMVLVYGSPAGGGTPDLKISFGEDATDRGAVQGTGFSSTSTISTAGVLANTGTTSVWGTDTANRGLLVRGAFVGAGGTFHVLWAQNTSGVNPTIMRAGSLVRYRRII